MNMASTDSNDSTQSQPQSPWYYSALAVSIIGAALSITILSLLVVNYARYRAGNIRMEAELETLNAKLAQESDDSEALADEIRQLEGRVNLPLFPFLFDGFGDQRCPPLFSIFPQYPFELLGW